VTGTSRKEKPGYIRFDPFTDDWAALGKVDVLINCIGLIEPTRFASFYDIHVRLVQEIIGHRAVIGQPKVVQISALGAAPNHPVAFLQTKGVADDLLLNEPDTIVLRPSIVCTPGTMIVQKLIGLRKLARHTMGRIAVPAGFLATQIQPVTRGDLVDVVKDACSRIDSNVVNVIGPQRYSFRELLELFFSCANLKFKPFETPRQLMDPIVRWIVSPLFRKILNNQQYLLLFQDNIANAEAISALLKRPLSPTADFFKQEARSGEGRESAGGTV